MELQRLEQFLYYLQEKIEDCYKFETKKSIERLIEELQNKK